MSAAKCASPCDRSWTGRLLSGRSRCNPGVCLGFRVQGFQQPSAAPARSCLVLCCLTVLLLLCLHFFSAPRSVALCDLHTFLQL